MTRLWLLLLLPILAWLIFRLFSRDRRNLGKIQWLMDRRRFDRALPLIRQRLDRVRRTKGENHLDTAVAKYSLGRIQYLHGRTGEGSRLVDEATAFFSTYSGPRDDDYWVHLLNLGVAQSAIDRLDLATETYRQAVDLQRNLHGPETERVAKAMNNLGVMLKKTGREQESIPIYEESLRIRTALHGDGSIQAAKVRVNLAEAYISAQQWVPAERHIQLAIKALQALPSHELGQAYDTYALLLEEQERFSQAEQMRTSALATMKRTLGAGSVEVAKQMEKYASLLGNLNRQTECELFKQKAAAIREALV
jgi:tetratricopeptide (TPR) repeat protein